MSWHKPPMGLKPKHIFKLTRLQDITEAINRYISAECIIPIEWVEEYNELIEELPSLTSKEELK